MIKLSCSPGHAIRALGHVFLVWFILASPVRGTIPEGFVTESGLTAIDTVELFRNGIYWWTASACTETANPGGASFRAFTDSRIYSSPASVVNPVSSAGGFTSGDLFADKGFLAARPSLPKGVLLPGCGYGAHFARDDEAFYYVRNRELYRKPFTAPANIEGPTINTLEGFRYVPVIADGALFANETTLWFYTADLRANNLTIYTSGKRGNVRPVEVATIPGVAIRKFTVAHVNGTDGKPLTSLLIILTPDGRLYQSALTGPAQLIRTGVSDFALRDEIYLVRGGPVIIGQKKHSTTLYYALGNPISYSGPGQLIGRSLNPGALSDFVEFNAGAGFRVTSVAVDSGRIFLTRTPASGIANSDLLRRRAPVDTSSIFSTGDTDYSTIALQREFRSLRSNGRSVYFAHRNTVQRLSTEAPAINLDFSAYALEVTQGIQNLDNTIRLVAGKPAVVRGYGEVLSNTTGLTNFDVPARLNVYRMVLGQPVAVPGSPFLPVQAPLLVPVPNYSNARTNLDASYQFQIPAEAMQAGRMRFQMELNSNRAVPETGTAPLANNSTSADLDVLETFTPNLIFTVMRTAIPNYDPRAADSGFWDIIARAKSLLPLSDFKVFFRSGVLSKPKLTFTGLKARTFDLPDDKDTALFWLGIVRGIDILDNQQPVGNSYYVGMFPPGVEGFNGLANRPGHVLTMRMATDNPTGAIWNSTYGGRTLAHELGHNFGRKHVLNDTNCSSAVPDGPFDVLPGGASGCTLGAVDLDLSTTTVGFDPISWSLVLPTASGDLLSYATTRWISEYNWNALLDVTSAQARMSFRSRDRLSALAEIPFLVVSGFYDAEANSGGLFPAYLVEGSRLHPEILAELTEPAPQDAPLRIQLVGGDGRILVDQPVEPQVAADEGISSAFIQRAIPMDNRAEKLRLINNGVILAEVLISALAPNIQLDEPVVDGGEVKLTWTGSDQDGDLLYYTVQYSSDDGESWQTLSVNIPESTVSFSTALLAGSETARARVIASDGVLSASATSERFTLPQHAPSVHLTGIRDGEQFDFATPISIEGFAYDAEDGSLSGAALQWAVTGPQALVGSGGSIALSSLTPGLYKLEFTATDSNGESSSENVQFIVRALAIADGEEPVLDGLCSDPAYGKTPPVRLLYGEGQYANTRFAHANGALFVCINGVHYGAGGAASSVGVRLKTLVASSGPNSAVGFAVDENGGIYRMNGDDNGLVLVTDPPAGFRVVILRDDNSWSAEMRVTDDLLGGWNHSLGVAVLADDGNAATPPVVWPPNADVNQPGTWASGHAGSLLPLPRDGNLLPYGDAEGLVGTDGSSASPLPGWTITGNLSVVSWGTQGGFPAHTDPGPESPGANFLAGGPASPSTIATTLIDIPSSTEKIDSGAITALLSGWLGGFAADDDAVSLRLDLLDASGLSLDQLTIGPVLASDRSGVTAFLPRSASKVLPVGTRRMRATLQFTRVAGSFNDGYADNLRLELREGQNTQPTNERPIANAGPNLTLEASSGKNLVTLDGSGSSDPENAPLTFIWRQINGTVLGVRDAETATPTVTFPAITEAATFAFELVVDDGTQESDPARIEITLLPPPFTGGNVQILNGTFEGAAFVVRASITGTGRAQLQRTSDLIAPAWTSIGNPIPVAGGDIVFRDETPPETENNFYRVTFGE